MTEEDIEEQWRTVKYRRRTMKDIEDSEGQ
jgi:hypothetical protein